MIINPNAFCPCRSGKKYKKCCGQDGKIAIPENMVLSRAIAYKGSIGRQREGFSLEFTGYLRQQHSVVYGKLRELVASQGKNITCHKGCTACCHLCVIVTVQECEAIVYYLYQHADVLQHFLQSFDLWRRMIREIWNTFLEIHRLVGKRMSPGLTKAEEAAFNEVLFIYRSRNIPCPFLKQGICSIYEVRPLVCAGLVATTPNEWCSPDHAFYEKSNLLTQEPKQNTYLPYFANPEQKPCFSFLPAGVFELLLDGWGFLGKLPGCEWLKENLKTEEEIQSFLRNYLQPGNKTQPGDIFSL